MSFLCGSFFTLRKVESGGGTGQRLQRVELLHMLDSHYSVILWWDPSHSKKHRFSPQHGWLTTPKNLWLQMNQNVWPLLFFLGFSCFRGTHAWADKHNVNCKHAGAETVLVKDRATFAILMGEEPYPLLRCLNYGKSYTDYYTDDGALLSLY